MKAISSGQDAGGEERWVTDADLLAARQRFADRIPGFEPPAAYSVARLDGGRLTFAYINTPPTEHRLPAVVLAVFCGYTNKTGVFPLGREDFSRAVSALQPAEAALHWEHPNLWSWRLLLEQADTDSEFIAFYVTHLEDPPIDERDAEFRSLLAQNDGATDDH